MAIGLTKDWNILVGKGSDWFVDLTEDRRGRVAVTEASNNSRRAPARGGARTSTGRSVTRTIDVGGLDEGDNIDTLWEHIDDRADIALVDHVANVAWLANVETLPQSQEHPTDNDFIGDWQFAPTGKVYCCRGVGVHEFHFTPTSHGAVSIPNLGADETVFMVVNELPPVTNQQFRVGSDAISFNTEAIKAPSGLASGQTLSLTVTGTPTGEIHGWVLVMKEAGVI